MPLFADPHRCPSCAGRIAGPVCSSCGLRLVGPTAGELFQTLQHADVLVDRLRAETLAQAAAMPPAAPAEVGTAPSVHVEGRGASTPAPRRATTVPAVLLTLGGISLASGAVVFLAIAWFVLGVGGRTIALVLLTSALGVGTWLTARRDLRAAAETLGTLTALFTAFDLVGARLAWFEATGLRPYTILAGLLLTTTCAGGVVALRDRARLWGPEAVGAAGLLVAAVAVLATDHHVPFVMGLVMVGGAAAAWATRRAGLPVLAVAGLGLAAIGWLLLVGYGVVAAVDDTRGAASTAGPLATAGLAALAVATLLPAGRAVAGTIGVWLLVGASVGWTDWFQTPTGALLVVAAGAVAGCAAHRGPWRQTGLGVGLTGTVVLLAATTGWTAELTEAIGRSGWHGWTARFVAAHDVPPWAAIAAFVLVVALAQRVRGLERHPSLVSAGVAAVGLTAAGYAHWTVVPAAFAVTAALVEAVIALRGSRGHWLAAAVLAVPAAAAASVGSGPESVVWWAAAVVGGVVLLRDRAPDRVVAAALAPSALAVALMLDGQALGVEPRWVAMATVALVYGAALALRPRASRPALAGGTLVAMLGAAAAGATTPGWLAAELTVIAAGCALAGILDRSRLEGLAATALGLVALWLRLGASDIHTPEAYTLPLAALVLTAGAWALRGDASRRTVPTIGTGLALALVPTWAIGLTHPLSSRALIAGLACVALVAAGARLRWQAPLLVGALAGSMLALVEVAPYASAVQRWVLLVAIGACLLAAGVRWEQLAAAGRWTWGRLADLR